LFKLPNICTRILVLCFSTRSPSNSSHSFPRCKIIVNSAVSKSPQEIADTELNLSIVIKVFGRPSTPSTAQVDGDRSKLRLDCKRALKHFLTHFFKNFCYWIQDHHGKCLYQWQCAERIVFPEMCKVLKQTGC
jgi:hypothetical protein